MTLEHEQKSFRDQSAITGQPLYLNGHVRIWSHFPGITVSHHGTNKIVGGIYYQLMQEERRRKKGPRKETAQQMRHRLLKEVERRITQMDDDDLFVILSA